MPRVTRNFVQVNAEVVDPDDPVTEKMISEDAAKLKKLHFHPDFQAFVVLMFPFGLKCWFPTGRH